MAIRYVKNLWAMLRQRADDNVWDLADTGAPTNGAAGTAFGFAGPGSTYTDKSTGIRYTNIGTLAVPVWSSDSAVAGLGGLGLTGNAKFTYDFAVDGGAIGPIIPANSPTLPIGSTILGGVIDVTTSLTSGGAATIALGFSAGAAADSLLAATAVASWTAGSALVVVPKFTAATFLKLTAAGRPQLTVAAFALTAGKFDVNLSYLRGN